MSTDQMLVQSKPFAVHQQVLLGLRVCSHVSKEGRERLTEGQVDTFDEGGLDERAEYSLV